MSTKLGVFNLLFFLPFSINAAFYGLEDIFSIRELKLSLGYPIDSLLNFTELVSKYGYRVQEHTVTTEDGYILKIFRLHGKNCREPLRQPPVLLMHGLLMTSDLWLDSGPNAGLAYLIADACYDLWVGNIRGNYYGKSHKKLNPEKDSDFWEFTLTEVGHFDMPAMIDYILIHTKNEFINYIGYSQGGSIYFIMCSERPNYCDKTRVAIMLAPGSRLKNVDSTILRLIIAFYQYTSPIFNAFGVYEAYPWGGIVQEFVAYFCKDYLTANIICRGFFDLLDSPHPGSIETNTLRVLVGHIPAGTSIKNILWYHQALNVDKFQKYDYGFYRNIKMYNSTKPPTYNLSATTTQTVIIRGKNDFFAVTEDLDWLSSRLPNVVEDFFVLDPLWNHFDIPYGKDTRRYLLPKIIECLNKYGTSSKIPGTWGQGIPWLIPLNIFENLFN